MWHIIFSYEGFRVIWWLLLGVLLIGLAVMDGFDLGTAFLLPVITKDSTERTMLVNSVAPFWDGNQVWLILGAGAILAAFSDLYGLIFSGFYFAIMAILWTLILRPVAFEFRSKINSSTWTNVWDILLFLSGLVVPLLFGVAIANSIVGVGYNLDSFNLKMSYSSSFISLLSPYAIMWGIFIWSILAMHGGAYLINRNTGDLYKKLRKFLIFFPFAPMILFIIVAIMSYYQNGYIVNYPLGHNMPSNPLLKHVFVIEHGLLRRYFNYFWLSIFPILSLGFMLLVVVFASWKKDVLVFIASALSIAMTIVSVGIVTFPMLIPSLTNPNISLTVFDATSSYLTLIIMSIASLIFVPIILVYTSWIYYMMRGRLDRAFVKKHKKDLY